MDDREVLPYVRERIPDFTPAGNPVRLPGGNLNVVWRVVGETESVIVKYAPPYIAADPETPLDPRRLLIEARCLEALAPTGILSSLSSPKIRAPRPLDVNETAHILLMEDVGDQPTIGEWVCDPEDEAAPVIGGRLGTFIGTLHARTAERAPFKSQFVNREMQETRQAVQYASVEEMLQRGGVSDASTLGDRARDLGERLLQPGCCLIMGDLWPPSVLVSGRQLRVIDWELAHYGRPLQDVAHWLAHLWMLKHRHGPDGIGVLDQLERSFLASYRRALGGRTDQLWTQKERRDAAIHYGAEILVRAVGPFQEGYVYSGLSSSSEAVTEAVTEAAEHLRHPGSTDLLPSSTESLPKS